MKHNTSTETKGGGTTLSGVVVSTKMKDTVTVKVTRFVKDPKYKKYVMRSKKYLAHDPGNMAKDGDRVTIRACRPISKRKRFEIIQGNTTA
jgi:small subunit ribosomal protein S17